MDKDYWIAAFVHAALELRGPLAEPMRIDHLAELAYPALGTLDPVAAAKREFVRPPPPQDRSNRARPEA